MSITRSGLYVGVLYKQRHFTETVLRVGVVVEHGVSCRSLRVTPGAVGLKSLRLRDTCAVRVLTTSEYTVVAPYGVSHLKHQVGLVCRAYVCVGLYHSIGRERVPCAPVAELRRGRRAENGGSILYGSIVLAIVEVEASCESVAREGVEVELRMLVCIGEQRQSLLYVGIYLGVELRKCATLVLGHESIVGLCGVRKAEFLVGSGRVVGAAEHVGEIEHRVGAAHKGLTELSLVVILVALLLYKGDSLIGSTHATVELVPYHLGALIVALGKLSPVVSLVLEAVVCSPARVLVLIGVVGVHLEQISGRAFRVCTDEQLADIVGRLQLHTVVGQFVEVAVTGSESHRGSNQRNSYI